MPRELYNEGRVVGYSAYELYVKHALSEFPDEEPASEREWLAAQLGNGSSLIVSISSESDTISGVHHVDIPLPEDTKLIAASTVIGSQFFGDCNFYRKEAEHTWATRVIDYGQGISNTAETSPETSTDASLYPKQTPAPFYANEDQSPKTVNTEGQYKGTYSQNTETEFLQYLKIQDALILQPGVWQDADCDGNPQKDFIPNYHEIPILRITFASRITTSFSILLTGFTHRSIIAGITGIDSGSTKEIHPENGDFLGPELYPWANKVIFMTPPVSQYFRHKYLASGHENRRDIDNTDAQTARVDNLRIDHDEDDVNTVFTSSYLYSSDGVSVVGPLTPGGNISIGSKLGSTGTAQNYIKVTQTHSDSSHKQVTDLQHSEITAGTGIAYHKPSTPAEEVKFTSMIATRNNYLKVEQVAKENLKANQVIASKANNQITSTELNSEQYGYTTLLSPSEFSASGGAIKIDPPSKPGEDVTFTVKIASSKEKYLQVQSANGNTVLTPASFSGGKNKDSDPNPYIVVKEPSSPGQNIQICLDWDKLVADLVSKLAQQPDFRQKLLGDIWGAIGQLLAKIGNGQATLSETDKSGHSAPSNADKLKSIDWSTDSIARSNDMKIPLGNLNVYSSTNGSDVNRYIKCHQTEASGDLRVN